MDLDQYMSAVATSNPSDWNREDGPLYLQTPVGAPSAVLSFKRNLSISLAYGLPHTEIFAEPWANSTLRGQAMSQHLDFFFNGVLVYRDVLVVVDGGRCFLPMPTAEDTLEVPRRWHDVAALVHRVAGLGWSFEEYVVRHRLTVIDAPWPA